MKKIRTWCALLALASGVSGVLPVAQAADADLVKRGEYLATAGDCVACHTAQGGKPFAGGLEIATPLGKIVSTNITPSRSEGIGNYTQEQFSDALRRGVRADGQHLYPAMPYTSYAQLADDDVKALYAYFMQSVPPVDTKPAATGLPFPFSIRLSMAAWNLLFLDRKPFVPDGAKSAEWNRGAYLALGLAHCSTCHTPRNALMAEDHSRALAGADLGTWYAPNISSDPVSGIGAWSEAELAEYLRSGRVDGKAQAGGPMAEAIDNSLGKLSDEDRRALAVYIKSSAPQRNAADTQAAHTWGKPMLVADSVRGGALALDTSRFNGAQLYDANCASCHQARGEGSTRWGGKDGASLPSLFHNTTLGHANSNNVVMAILQGIERKQGGAEVMMPAFGNQLNDEQIASLSNYLLQNFGNPAAKVTVEQVKTLRAGGPASPLLNLARIGMLVGGLLVVLIIALLLRRKRTASGR
jgi:mono/diheme cytochrome c family protein